MTETTSLSVTHGVRERVKRCAEFKDETYSSILTRIMDDSEKVNTPPYGGEYYSEEEVFELVHDFEQFKEYIYGDGDAVVDGAMYKKSEVGRFRNR